LINETEFIIICVIRRKNSPSREEWKSQQKAPFSDAPSQIS